jgi:hypothetical protein
MKVVFVELPAFERHRSEYLDDEGFRGLQIALMKNPEAGDLIEGAGGLRKVRYGKDEMEDLTPEQKRELKNKVKLELAARS